MGEGTCSSTCPDKTSRGTTNASLNVAGSQIKNNTHWGLGVGKCVVKINGSVGGKKGELIESDVVDIYLIIKVKEKGALSNF